MIYFFGRHIYVLVSRFSSRISKSHRVSFSRGAVWLTFTSHTKSLFSSASNLTGINLQELHTKFPSENMRDDEESSQILTQMWESNLRKYQHTQSYTHTYNVELHEYWMLRMMIMYNIPTHSMTWILYALIKFKISSQERMVDASCCVERLREEFLDLQMTWSVIAEFEENQFQKSLRISA